MGRYTKQDVIDLVRENDVEFIRLQFSDLFGTMKNVAITARQLEKALDNKCTFDGSSVDGFVRIEESDMYLYPDLDSFAIFPWNAGGNRVARLICDVYGQDGLPFAGDPRNVLKRVMVECQKMGYKFNVGPECEFFYSTQMKKAAQRRFLMRKPDILMQLRQIQEKVPEEI